MINDADNYVKFVSKCTFHVIVDIKLKKKSNTIYNKIYREQFCFIFEFLKEKKENVYIPT